ncbi:MAG TPA: hypothetical protein VFY83_15120, partial [Anaerolineales bacterium]|nr:hypothetical protein [Anaerolineales bacterium]
MDLQRDPPGKDADFKPPAEPVEQSTASGDIYNLSGDFRGATINIKSILEADIHWVVNREHMLQRVRKDWLAGVLEPARAGHALIALDIDYRSNLLESPWTSVIQRKESLPRPPSTSQQIQQVFDEANGNLLILGEPGSGKTITLLQMAQELVRRAEADPTTHIPVVLNLSSWGEEQAPLQDWLVKELRGKYFMPQSVAQSWIDKDILTLLLDGLDEVPEEKRPGCIEAINAYRHDHGAVQIVVCSRRTDYESQPQRLQLDEAILLRPLNQAQIHQFLATHRQGQDMAATLEQDTTLRQLARTPLMLNIMLLASQEVSSADWSNLKSFAAHREHLFEVYLKSMFKRRRLSDSQLEASTLQVLPWLAGRMSEQGKTVFLLENLDPSWLKTNSQRWMFTVGLRLVSALLLGLAVSLTYVVGLEKYAPRMFLATGAAVLVTGLLSLRLNHVITLLLCMALTGLTSAWALNEPMGGLFAGFILGVPGGAVLIAIRDPRMTEKIHWSWKRTALVMAAIILAEILVGYVIYQIGGLPTLSSITEILMFGALPIGMSITLSFGRRPNLRMAPTVKPNQGYWQSLRNAIGITVFLVLVLLPLTLPFGVSRNLLAGQPPWQAENILNSLGFMTALIGFAALPLGFYFGGAACLQQLLVRSILHSAESLPWNLVRILDHATDRIILQRVGGGYIFQHR